MIDSGSDVWWWEKMRNTTRPETAALLRGVRPPRGTTTLPHFHSHLRCNIVRQYTPSSFALSNNTSPHADMRQAETEMYASSGLSRFLLRPSCVPSHQGGRVSPGAAW